jgi:putative glutamine amidotransferase
MTAVLRPLIGISLDYVPTGGYSEFPHVALRIDYAKAVASAGGIPIMLPPLMDQIPVYLESIDGLIIPGGDVDIPPSYYGEDDVHATTQLNTVRTDFDIAITREAIARNLPFLGICAGEQVMNVVLGGTLMQHIPDALPHALAHKPEDRKGVAHTIDIKEDSLLARITEGTLRIGVNSSHHQAVRTVGSSVRISALAADGVIEAIEYVPHPFCLGIEWHPEYVTTHHDSAIFKAFVSAAKDYARIDNKAA